MTTKLNANPPFLSDDCDYPRETHEAQIVPRDGELRAYAYLHLALPCDQVTVLHLALATYRARTGDARSPHGAILIAILKDWLDHD